MHLIYFPVLHSLMDPVKTFFRLKRLTIYFIFVLQPGSPAVHIVDLNCSPSTPRYRKRWNSGGSETDSEIPYKRPTPERHPSTENEIAYIAKSQHFRKVCPCTPIRGKPIAMVSPITKSMSKVPKSLQVS